MSIFNVSRSMLVAIAVTLPSFVAAQAGTIYTPTVPIHAKRQAMCIAVNAYGFPVTVTVKLRSSNNLDATRTCTLPVVDRLGCEANRFYDTNVTARCFFEISGLTNAQVRERVRGILIYRLKPENGALWSPDLVVEAD